MTEVHTRDSQVDDLQIEAARLRGQEATGANRTAVAIERLAARLDMLESRKSDADLGRAFRTGRGVLGPLVAIVVTIVSVMGWVELRAASVARAEIQGPDTRGQVADQIHAQVDPLKEQLARREDVVAIREQLTALRESLAVAQTLRRIEEQTRGRAPRETRP